jgi:OOP family OmpA-OmpF porin
VKSFLYLGIASGMVIDDETGAPVPGAQVAIPGLVTGEAGAEGAFQLREVPAGLAVVSASAPGYLAAEAAVDIVADLESGGIELRLKRSAAADFFGQTVRAGDRITLNLIQFDMNSAELRSEGVAELDRVARFLKDNPTAEIELAGHTSSEGGVDLNRALSFRRVFACKTQLVSAGIDAARITTVGHGPDLPIAPNDTEANRALNRRVEMKLNQL